MEISVTADTPILKTIASPTIKRGRRSSSSHEASKSSPSTPGPSRLPRLSTANLSPRQLIKNVIAEKARRKSSFYVPKVQEPPAVTASPNISDSDADKTQENQPEDSSQTPLKKEEDTPSISTSPFIHPEKWKPRFRATLDEFTRDLEQARKKARSVTTSIETLIVESQENLPEVSTPSVSKRLPQFSVPEASSLRTASSKSRGRGKRIATPVSPRSPRGGQAAPTTSVSELLLPDDDADDESVPPRQDQTGEKEQDDESEDEEESDVEVVEEPSSARKKARPRRRSIPNRMPSLLTRTNFRHFCNDLPVTKEAFEFVEECSDIFFKNLADDLMAYARHAKRKAVTEDDVTLLLRRQGHITDNESLESLAAKYLPQEYRSEFIPMATANNVIVPQ